MLTCFLCGLPLSPSAELDDLGLCDACLPAMQAALAEHQFATMWYHTLPAVTQHEIDALLAERDGLIVVKRVNGHYVPTRLSGSHGVLAAIQDPTMFRVVGLPGEERR